MELLEPIYTKTTECRDCYKCLRQCEVKAIKIRNGHAMIMPELCILCGNCVKVCPAGAKKVRDDIERAKLLIKMRKKVVVSLAPSFISEFGEITPTNLIKAFKKLGFYGVSETALGAEEVSANVADHLTKHNGISISSACPTVVELLKKYHADLPGYVTDFLSPVLTHCKMLRNYYGHDMGIVFVGPCIAKKVESDVNNDLLNAALTFEEVQQWWENEGIDIAADYNENCKDESFVPHSAGEGALYPVDGGMIAGIKANCRVDDSSFMTFSGIKNIRQALEDIDQIDASKNLFLELLACEGGCINGPASKAPGSTIVKRCSVFGNAKTENCQWPRKPQIEIASNWQIDAVTEDKYDSTDIRNALQKIGKYSPADELNCGSCGYDSCKEFAKALINGKAEIDMCVGYMRKLAAKKADAVISAMPSGIVIANEELKIVECNRRFAEIIGEDVAAIYEVCPELKNARLDKIISFKGLFEHILFGDADQIEKDVNLKDGRILHVSIFTIEKGRLAGGVIQDITEPAVQKEQIVNKAKEVIAKNLETVQKIAFLLGENAADSEVILKSIVNSFSADSYQGGDLDA